MLMLAIALAGCGKGNSEPQLTVVGASSLTEALGEYAESFPGAEVRTAFAGSDQLAAQIRQGARPDVFASADTEYPAALHREGLVGKPLIFAGNRLAVLVPASGPISSFRDLARTGTRIVIGSSSVPVGAYTRTMLSHLPPAEGEAILANVRSEEPEVSAILAKVANGAADAGIVYATDAKAVHGQVRTVAVPDALQPAIAYAAAVVSGTAQPALSRSFIHGLLHGNGATALRHAGFLPPP